ncbi:MAG: hypothetical protein QM757_26355 [Paludibaculum sp.]
MNIPDDISTLECKCSDSKFCDPTHGHVVTGDLRIISNQRLRSLLTKRPKYREKERIRWDKVLHYISEGIAECATNWAKLEKVDTKVLGEWRSSLLDQVQQKIRSIKKMKRVKKFINPICKKILNRSDVKQDLQWLHEQYV